MMIFCPCCKLVTNDD